MLNEALRLIRVFHDMTQSEAAKNIGISKSYLSEIEKGPKEPSLDILRRYESTFNIPLSSILFFSESLRESSPKEHTRAYIADKILKIMSFLESRSSKAHEES